MSEHYQFSRYHFQGQHENEQVLRVIHRHWFNIIVHFSVVIFSGFFVIGSLSILPLLSPAGLPGTSALFHFIQNTALLSLWLYCFLVWIDYYLDVWIVTNERIVNIEQKGLFSRHISELRFSKVQDVTSSANGLIATILNFGDVYVQTAAEQERFIFRQVGNPFAIKDEIMRLARDATHDELREVATTLQTADK